MIALLLMFIAVYTLERHGVFHMHVFLIEYFFEFDRK